VYFQEVLLSLSVDPSTTAYSNSGPQGNPGKEIAQYFGLAVGGVEYSSSCWSITRVFSQTSHR